MHKRVTEVDSSLISNPIWHSYCTTALLSLTLADSKIRLCATRENCQIKLKLIFMSSPPVFLTDDASI